MQETIRENEEKELRVLRKNEEREEQLKREHQNQVEQLRRENKQLEEEQRRKNEERLAFLLLENETQLANLVAKQEEEEEKKKEEGVSRKRKVEELETNKQPAAPECPVCLFEFQLFVCCSNSVTGLPERDGASNKDIPLCQRSPHLRDLQVGGFDWHCYFFSSN